MVAAETASAIARRRARETVWDATAEQNLKRTHAAHTIVGSLQLNLWEPDSAGAGAGREAQL